MKTRLDPTVLDQAREQLGLSSDEKLGAKIGRTGQTIRCWRKGSSTPKVSDLVKLQFLTGRPYGTILLIDAVAA
ncbi:transcriptional regulator [Corynebacterium diphtheriae]